MVKNEGFDEKAQLYLQKLFVLFLEDYFIGMGYFISIPSICKYLFIIAVIYFGVNPFDQPGVEAYKKNMFALLGKPGYESEKDALEARLK